MSLKRRARLREERWQPAYATRCVVSSHVPHYALHGHETTKRPGPGLGEWGFTKTEGTRRSHAETLTRAMTPEMNTVGLGGLQGKERRVRRKLTERGRGCQGGRGWFQGRVRSNDGREEEAGLKTLPLCYFITMTAWQGLRTQESSTSS